MTNRVLIIGDIHGMLAELNALIEVFDPQPGDRIVSVGDLVHKGPDSAGVVKRLRHLGAELVEGNHDGKQTRFRRGIDALHLKDDTLTLEEAANRIKMTGKEEMVAIERRLDADDVVFLAGAKLWIDVPGGIVVHGGILPEWDTLPIGDLSKGEKKVWERLTRTRFVRGEAEVTVTVDFTGNEDIDLDNFSDVERFTEDAVVVKAVRKKVKPKGAFLSLGREGPEDPFWAEVYDGRFGHAYFGHQPWLEEETPKLFPHATGLDLGAVFGGHLAAVVLEPGEPTRSLVTKATGKFARSLWEE